MTAIICGVIFILEHLICMTNGYVGISVLFHMRELRLKGSDLPKLSSEGQRIETRLLDSEFNCFH
jgi:hypothetical protein